MRRSNTFAAILLLLVTLLAYGRLVVTPGQEFVFDDIRFVKANEAVHDLSNWSRYFTDPKTVDPGAWRGIYRPLRTLDFAIDWAVAGASPWWFHLRNILYHGIAAILVMMLLRRWGADRVASLLGALVFALHPAQVEAVGWITSRGDVLYLVFFLFALLLHDGGRKINLRFGSAATLLGLALLAKEAAVVFVAVAVCSDFFFRDGRRIGKTLTRWPRYVAYAAVTGGYLALRFVVQRSEGAELAQLSEHWGVLTAFRGLVYDLRLMVLPVDMVVDPFISRVTSPDVLSLLCVAIVLGALTWAVVRAFRGGGALSFAIIWFAVTILPVSNLIVTLRSPTAERFLYLPMIGFTLPVGRWLARFVGSRPAGAVGVAAVLLCLFAVTVERTGAWTTNRRLWESAVTRNGSFRAHLFMADKHADDGRVDESIHEFERGIEELAKLPNTWEPIRQYRADHALRLVRLGRPKDGLALAEGVLRDWPELASAHHARAAAYLKLGRVLDARAAIETALVHGETESRRRAAAVIYRHLARYLDRKGDAANRRQALLRSWELWPDPEANAEVRRLLDE